MRRLEALGDWIAWAISRVVLGFLIAACVGMVIAPGLAFMLK